MTNFDPNPNSTFLQMMVDNAEDGIVIANEKGRFVLFNPAAQRMCGLGAVDSEPKEWSEVYQLYQIDGVTPFPPESVPLVRALAGERVTNQLMLIKNPVLGDLVVECSATPFFDEKGKVSGGVVVFRDVTHRVHADKSKQKIGKVVMDLGLRRLEGEKGSYDLSPAAMRVFKCLAEAPGSVVRREVIKTRTWGDTIVSNNALDQRVREIRQGLSQVTDSLEVTSIYGQGLRLVVHSI